MLNKIVAMNNIKILISVYLPSITKAASSKKCNTAMDNCYWYKTSHTTFLYH